MGFIKAMLFLVGIPIFGYGIGTWVLSDINKEIAASGMDATIREICVAEVLAATPDLKPLCDQVQPVFWMQDASILSAVVATLLLLSFTLFAAIAGQSRTKITKIFPPLVFVSLCILTVLVIVQGAILTYGVYLAEVYAIERVHFVIIAGIGLAAFLGGIGLISSAFKMAGKQEHSVLGLSLPNQDYPNLYKYVQNIANKLGARCPDNIVVGLEPNYYVTSANVTVMGEGAKLKGETLFLSLPLSRILTVDELTGVIGHELGHFRGQDTYYSLKFSPVYSGLSHAISSMDSKQEGQGPGIATLPALVLLSYMIDVFHKNVSAISRDREFEADKAGAEVANGAALATSLLKISLYAHSWNNIQENIVVRLQQGKITRNMSLLFSHIVKYDVDFDKLPETILSIGEETISHPTDSHPPTSSRIEKLGLDIKTIDTSTLLLPKESAVEVIDGYREIEEKLTVIQQQYYSALGVQIPDEEQGSMGAKILSAFGAHMVLADDKVEAEEIEEAEGIGLSLTESFDVIEFREFCHHPEDIPELDKLIDIAKDFEDDFKNTICDYLSRIASADDDVCEEEQALLSRVKLQLGV